MQKTILIPITITLLLTPVVRMIAVKKGVVDYPDGFRKHHNGSIPLWGGVAIYLSFYITLTITGNLTKEMIWFWLGSTIVLAIGMLDDAYGLPPLVKLSGQALAASIPILLKTPFRLDWLPSFYMDTWFYNIATIIWIVGICNAVNLIDGLDGLATGISAISALSMFIILSNNVYHAQVALILAFACIGFLPYNLSRKKIFLGDAGSLFLGYSLGFISILTFTKKAAGFSIILPFFLMALPIMDTASAIIRRKLNGIPIMTADSSHIHHRLINKGFSQIQTLFILYGITVFFSSWAIILDRIPTLWWLPVISFTLIAIIGQILYSPSSKRRYLREGQR